MPVKTKQEEFISKAMAAVADPYRLQILEEILEKGSIRCSDVVGMTGLSQPTCSHHIRLLSETCLIDCRKEGRNNYFTLNRENFKRLSDYLKKFSN